MRNNKIVAIIKNDVERSIKNKWFVILNLLLLVVTVIILNFNNIRSIFKNDENYVENSVTIYVQDEQDLAYEQIVQAFNNNIDVDVEKTDNIQKYNNEQLDTNIILLDIQPDDTEYIKALIIFKDGTSNEYINIIESTLNSIKDTMISENKNLTLQEIEQIKQQTTIEMTVIANEENNVHQNGLYLISNYLIFFILLLCLSKIANTISQEKM